MSLSKGKKSRHESACCRLRCAAYYGSAGCIVHFQKIGAAGEPRTSGVGAFFVLRVQEQRCTGFEHGVCIFRGIVWEWAVVLDIFFCFVAFFVGSI